MRLMTRGGRLVGVVLVGVVVTISVGQIIGDSYGRDQEVGEVMAIEISVTPEPSATPSPTPVPTPPPKPTPRPSPKAKEGAAEFTPEQIYNFTESYGREYGVDPNVIRHIALCESTFKPQAKNYIYAGLFQFDRRTWTLYRAKMGKSPDPDLRYNAQEAVQTAAYVLSLGHGRIWPNCMPR